MGFPVPLIAAGASALGGIAQSAMGVHSANKQMRFQERMSNTTHQREVKDLVAAGLNPILSARLGGASAPPGSAYQAHENIGASAVGSYAQAQATQKQTELLEAQTRDINATAALKEIELGDKSETGVERIATIRAQLRQATENAGLSATQKQIAERVLSQQRFVSEKLENEASASGYALEQQAKVAKFWHSYGGTVAPWIKEIVEPLINVLPSVAITKIVNQLMKGKGVKTIPGLER